MAEKSNFRGKKIPKYLLDDEILNELDNKACVDDVWGKASPITMDAFDANVRNKLNNIAPPGAAAYDDTELRNRIINVEKAVLQNADAFHKSIEKVDESLLDSELVSILNSVRTNIPLIGEKADKSYVDGNFRRKDESIYQSDLDKDFSDKINNLVAAVNNVFAQSGLSTSINTDMDALKKEVRLLASAAVTAETLKNYRLKSEPVTMADLEAAAERAIRSAVSITDEVNKKLNSTDAEAVYRKKTDAIRISDMDTGLQNTINKVALAVESNEAAVTQIFNEKLFSSVKEWARDYFGTLMYSDEDKLGHIYPYQFAHNVCSYAGNLGAGTENAGKLTFASVCNYLYDRLNKADSSISSVNTSLLSLKNTGFAALTQRVSSLETEVGTLKEKNAALERESGELKSRLSSAEAFAMDLKERIEALESRKNETVKV